MPPFSLPVAHLQGPYVEFYNFCKSLQIPSELIPSGDELANMRIPAAEPEPKNAQVVFAELRHFSVEN